MTAQDLTTSGQRRRSRSKLRRLTAHVKHKSLTAHSESVPASSPGGVSTAHSFHVQPTLDIPLDTASSSAHTTECDSPTSETFPTFANPRSRSRVRSGSQSESQCPSHSESQSEINTVEGSDASCADIRSSIMRTNSDKTLQWERGQSGAEDDLKRGSMGEDSLDEDSLAYDAPHAEGHQLQAFTRSPLGREYCSAFLPFLPIIALLYAHSPFLCAYFHSLLLKSPPSHAVMYSRDPDAGP